MTYKTLAKRLGSAKKPATPTEIANAFGCSDERVHYWKKVDRVPARVVKYELPMIGR